MNGKPVPKVVHLNSVSLSDYIHYTAKEIKHVRSNNNNLSLCYISVHTSHGDVVLERMEDQQVFENLPISVKCRVARHEVDEIKGRSNLFISIDARMIREELRSDIYKMSLLTLKSLSLRGKQTAFVWNGPKPLGV